MNFRQKFFCRREEGKYKNNILICSNRKKGLLFVRSSKIKERVENAVDAANRAATIAQQKVFSFLKELLLLIKYTCRDAEMLNTCFFYVQKLRS